MILKYKKITVLIALMFIFSLSYAHEFWLEPMKFLLQQNEKLLLKLMVGEDYMGEPSNGTKYKIVMLDHYFGNKKEDIRKEVIGDSLNEVNIALAESGNHLIAFNNTSKFIQLEAAKFNDYLRSEGLDNVLLLRKQTNDTLKPGRELYQRCVKTLVQVGEKHDKTFAINTGMPLEIIPSVNPYLIKRKAPITFMVLFENKPVKGGLILAWHRENGKTTHTTLRSNEKGEVTFSISESGKWMISTVHMIAGKDKKTADWQSFWGSYTFGYF